MGDVSDGRQDGEGAASLFKEQNTYSYELRIPLSSGDSYDLAVAAGDTIGVQMVIYPNDSSAKYTVGWHPLDKMVWPGAGWAAPNTFAKIVLAGGPG
jgi:hypothetical protein